MGDSGGRVGTRTKSGDRVIVWKGIAARGFHSILRRLNPLWHRAFTSFDRVREEIEMDRHRRQILGLDERLLRDVGLSAADAWKIARRRDKRGK
ncbi:hypothetical protein HEQ60_04990 [Haematospirillum sp. H1815]|uniref:hypothetical protein n=1 Tax=Haematospirillum sp. H1815 TaxID=2723108 RepID=UPI00143BAA3B|nr:hypothetical protein [Haematospirillum sp. H1815]NKD77115.1 hypothetical protein [Haematospirillum sp. H1815]